MFPLCYICFTKIVQFEKRNSGNVQLIFIFTYKYSERWVQRQAKFTFPAWLYRTVPMSYKYTNKRERSKTKLALILFSRAKVSSSFNSNIVKGECNGKRNLHFRLDSAEPYPIFYKYNERCVQNKTNTLVFHTESYLISRFGKDLLLFCSGSEGTIIYSIPNTRSIVTK